MAAITATRTYSENRTADLLGVGRTTLALWRRGGKLRSDLVLTGIRPAGKGSDLTYDAAVVDAIVAGEQSPFEIPKS